MAKDATTRTTEPHHTAATTNDTSGGWVEIQDHRPMYFAHLCDGMAIKGYLLGTMEMNPSNKNVKADVPLEEQFWIALVVKLTAPCKLRSPDQDVREYPAGTECLVGGADMAKLYNFADHPTVAWEVMLKPTKELQLGGGRRMMRFEKKYNQVPVNREEHKLVFLEGRSAAAQLAEQLNGGVASGSHRAALPQHAATP